jgi:hypothetical protein
MTASKEMRFFYFRPFPPIFLPHPDIRLLLQAKAPRYTDPYRQRVPHLHINPSARCDF